MPAGLNCYIMEIHFVHRGLHLLLTHFASKPKGPV